MGLILNGDGFLFCFFQTIFHHLPANERFDNLHFLL